MSFETQKPYILGLSCLYHDSSAVLLHGDDILAAAQEERFTRKKFDSSFPVHAIAYCLKQAGITPEQLDHIAFFEEPYVKMDRLIRTQIEYAPLRIGRNADRIIRFAQNKLYVEDMIHSALPAFKKKVSFWHHHLSHTAAAFFPSPYTKAAVLTIDAIGEWGCTSLGIGDGNRVQIIEEQRFPHSLGLFYSAVTQYVGFKVDSGEYKLMGLAPYGEPDYVDLMKKHLIEVQENGAIRLEVSYFDFLVGQKMTNETFHRLFGAPPRKSSDPLTQKHMNIARSAQVIAEEAVARMVTYTTQKTGLRTLCMAGGVALNCVANGKLLKKKLVDHLWVQPAAGDAGNALGAAMLAAYRLYGLKRDRDEQTDTQKNSLLGPGYSRGEIQTILDGLGFKSEVLPEGSREDRIAQVINDGHVVGLFQGRMEFGPRALGNRSIIGDPRNEEMQTKMNLKIKFRESFRPFAPIVKEDRAAEWFDMDRQHPFHYMLLTTTVRDGKRLSSPNGKTGLERLKEKRSDVPAITHVDYSARVQTVSADTNPKLYKLLTAFEKLTGCPILINTSFNVRGEPIVQSPLDALTCFMNTDMDALVLEDFLLFKKDQDPQLLKNEKFKDVVAQD